MKQDISKTRRQFMQSAVALPWVAALTSLQSRTSWGAEPSPLIPSPYLGLAPVNDDITHLPLLQLPAGFSYKSFSWTGDPLDIPTRNPCPDRHDGMGVVRDPANPDDIWLIRNHEIGTGMDASWFGTPRTCVYDKGTFSNGQYANGGTTSLLFRGGNWIQAIPSLGGTRTNCAGGATPWGTWLSCEEEGNQSASSTGKKHGYVFEVQFLPNPSNAKPIIPMGRFKHEAAAVHPDKSIVYMTEDSEGKAGLYRYLPNEETGAIGSLAKGGVLQMAKVKNRNNVDIRAPEVGQSHELQWVKIAKPDQGEGTARAINGSTIANCSGPFRQGYALGALRMNRGEGIAYHAGKIYIMDTAGGALKKGAIWELDVASQKLTCFYVSAGKMINDMGDNIIVSPRGGLLMCEDPTSVPENSGARLMGLTSKGEIFIFAQNNYDLTVDQLIAARKSDQLSGNRKESEFCGACFDKTGTWLFVNQQDPGITFAITGPWEKGPL